MTTQSASNPRDCKSPRDAKARSQNIGDRLETLPMQRGTARKRTHSTDLQTGYMMVCIDGWLSEGEERKSALVESLSAQPE